MVPNLIPGKEEKEQGEYLIHLSRQLSLSGEARIYFSRFVNTANTFLHQSHLVHIVQNLSNPSFIAVHTSDRRHSSKCHPRQPQLMSAPSTAASYVNYLPGPKPSLPHPSATASVLTSPPLRPTALGSIYLLVARRQSKRCNICVRSVFT